METAFEKIVTHSHKPKIRSYVIAHPRVFEEAIKLAIADKQPYSWRSAWFLWSFMDKNDKRIQKYVKDIIDVLPNRKDNQQRELFKILEQMEIKEKFEGALFKHCVTVWEEIEKQVSVRFNAFKILVKIARTHPELSQEVILLTQNQYTEFLSSSVKKSIYKMITDIK
jgi:hypothetical protein